MVSEELQLGFAQVLIGDILHASERLEGDDNDGNRRELVRTVFAAIEGLSWVYREFIRNAADDLSISTPMLDLALQERTYAVSETGELIEQTRFISLPSMIRLTTKIVEEACPQFEADFSHIGWAKLKQAIGVRNRLVHPKSMRDLHISAENLEAVKTGFFWLLALVTEAMSATTKELAVFNDQARELLERLKAGDEEALAAYREVIATS